MCYSVYDFKSCIEQVGTISHSKLCTHKEHPNSRLGCDTLLLKTVVLNNGKKVLYPFKVFCYRSLKTSLQCLLLRAGFADTCEHWRSRREKAGVYQDIYDGKIWKELRYIDGKPFLAKQYVFALMLNIDWFKPFKHTPASVGAMYVTVMNLPYDQRFKRENVILLGIIPGPSEPKRDLNDYLQPFIAELQEFFTGVSMDVCGKTEKQVVRCLLIGVPCDMPVSRKVCGFFGHAALLACTRCLKIFPGSIRDGTKNYSSFDRVSWPHRSNSNHRTAIDKIKAAKTLNDRDRLETQNGCRYTILLELPYFDPTRMCIIDPMHNLFLGTAKHIAKNIWMDERFNLLTSEKVLKGIQSHMDDMHMPSDIGRIPRKLESGFSGFTADQYKNCVTLYSIPSLYGILSNDDIECWCHFVLACRILCK